MKNFLLIFSISVLLLNGSSSQKPLFYSKIIYHSGENSYHTYRIPALAVTKSGTILAFAEGRKDSMSDTGDIDMLVRRSTDNGNTWTPQQIVWDDEENVCGNPCPVVDQETGTIWILMTWNRGDDHEPDIIDLKSTDTRRVFVTYSKDDGLTWAQPKEITNDVKLPNWTWYATGPCTGIQIEKGKYAGRLVVPCDHIEAETKHYYSHTIYSDDHGETWQIGGTTPQHQVNECTVVELENDQLMLNMRNYDRSKKSRQIAYSNDGGITWTDQKLDDELVEPICQASLTRYSWSSDSTKDIILFSNPACDTARLNMTLRASFDEGETWSKQLVLNEGHSAYSDIEVLNNGQIIGALEIGEENPYQTITFVRLDMDILKPVSK